MYVFHICFITNEYPKYGHSHGGIGTFVKTLGCELVRKGVKVSVVGINYENSTETEFDNGVSVHRLKPRRFKGLTWLLNAKTISQKIKELNQVQKIDVVEGAELSLAFINKIRSVNYVIRMHGGHHFFAEAEQRGINPWKGFQEKLSFKKADKVIGVGQYVMDHTAKYINFETKRGTVIYNPVNLVKFYKSDLSNIEPDRIFFAGTLCEKKGIRQLIQALPFIKLQCPNVKLYIAGRDSLMRDGGSYLSFLKTLITSDIDSSIFFMGQVNNDEIPLLIEKSEICVYPSHMESFGLVAVEAMCMSKPVIFSNRGPGNEIIEDGVTGLLCDPFSPNDIAEKVIYLLKNKDVALELGENARRNVVSRFNLEILVQENIDFYKSLL